MQSGNKLNMEEAAVIYLLLSNFLPTHYPIYCASSTTVSDALSLYRVATTAKPVSTALNYLQCVTTAFMSY